jgi:hypothetical protein
VRFSDGLVRDWILFGAQIFGSASKDRLFVAVDSQMATGGFVWPIIWWDFGICVDVKGFWWRKNIKLPAASFKFF